MTVDSFVVIIKIVPQAERTGLLQTYDESTVGIKSEDGSFGVWDYANHETVEDVIRYDLPRVYSVYKDKKDGRTQE